jgi:type IV pilus assembly protein PilW
MSKFDPQRGLTLVELMIAMTLGLVLTGGVIGVFLANQQTYRVNQAISEVQESARAAFQLMARDIRNAGFNGCTNSMTVANTLKNNVATDWWSTWSNGIRGFDSSAPAAFTPAQLANTDAVQLMFGGGRSLNVETHNANAAQFKINKTNHGINDGDILIACDPGHAAIFQVTNSSQSNATIVHNTGTGTPGNCTKLLGYPVLCEESGLGGTPYQFTANSMLFQFQSIAWYVGVNPRGTNSLYRVSISGSAPVTEEIIEGVADLQFRFLRNGGTNYQTATAINAVSADEWARVVSVEIDLLLTAATTNTNLPEDLRRIRQVVTLRNRVE